MSDEQDKLGTPNQEAGDAAEEPTTGAPEEEGRGGLPADDIAKLNLEWKAKAERLNALEAQFGPDFAERLTQSPAAEDDEAGTEPEDDDRKGLREWADKNDPVAKYILKLEEKIELKDQAAAKRQYDAAQLRDIEDKALRQEVYTHYQKNRNRLGDPNAALAEVKAGKLEAEVEKLRLALQQQSKRPPDNGVRTSEREVPAAEHKIRKMTQAEWTKDQESLETNHALRMQRQNERRKGLIQVQG